MSRTTVTAVAIAVALVGGAARAEIPSFYDLRVEGIEVTQGIQTASNEIPLIDDRATTVRVFVDFAPAFFTAMSNVHARLRIYDGPDLLYSGLAQNGPATIPQEIDRAVADSTLNFDWVPDLGVLGSDAREVRFEVTLDPANAIREFDETNNTAEVVLPFTCRGGPDIAFVPVDYQFENADPDEIGTPEPDLIESGAGDAFVQGIFPFSWGPRVDQARYRDSSLEALEWDQDIERSFSDLLAEVERQRLATSPTPDHLYGWMRGNPYSSNGRGMVPGGAAWGNTDETRHQRTFAHELGHNLGFSHVRNTTGEIGWDVGDRLGLGAAKRDDLFDIMVGGQLTNSAWIDPARYQGLYDDGRWQCRDPIPFQILEFMEIAILAELEGGFRVGPVFPLYAERPEIVQVLEGRGVARLFDGNETLLYEQYFDPFPPEADSEDGLASGDTVVTPNFPDAQALEVRIDGQLVERRDRTPSAPVVTILSPETGQPIGDGTEIVWTMDDEDRDPLHALVRYSPDGESRWVPLGPSTTGTSLVLRAGKLPSTTAGVIEVRVTDGFNVTTETVGALRLGPNRLPRASILSPRDGHAIAEGAPLFLVGDVVDPEEGTLQDGVQWFSSLDGPLGEGLRVGVFEGLSRGTHAIDLVSTDSEGGESGDSIVVHVGTLATGPSPGEAGGANPMRVTGYDRATGAISISFGTACEAADHAVHAGRLEGVDSYAYEQTFCDLGTSGAATFTPVGDALFFLVVGEDGRNEGSYGLDGDGNERPESVASGTCAYPQALAARCD